MNVMRTLSHAMKGKLTPEDKKQAQDRAARQAAEAKEKAKPGDLERATREAASPFSWLLNRRNQQKK